ncbi:MAG: hypothetical protein R3C39_05890 [Dehalococcoidia bacterium]
MRFTRNDLPGLLIAALAPAGAMLIFLASFETWDHHGTPLLGFMAGNLAGGVATIAAFTRFVKNWDVVVVLIGAMFAAIAGVLWAQLSGHDGTSAATTLKWVALIAFLLVNGAVVLQIFVNGLLPIMDRRAAAKRAALEAAEA